jgi:hypothetical protein
MPESRTWTVALPPGTPILTANNRLNPFARNKRVQEIRQVVGQVLMCQRLPEPFPAARVLVEYASPPIRRVDRHPLASQAIRDADNIAPTGKACLDALVSVGVLPTDARHCVRRVSYQLAERPHPRGVVTITLTEAA